MPARVHTGRRALRRLSRALVLCLGALVLPAGAQQGGALPEGPGVDLVYAKCRQCHPISYVTESAGLPDFLWKDTLSLMNRLGMQVTQEEEETLYRYLTTYLGTDPPPERAADAPATAGVDGAGVYAASCAACHGPRGQGSAGAFPPLAGHAAELAAADRGYLPLVVVYGLAGDIEIDGSQYGGVMPPWAHLSNDQIAAVLNEVTAWDPAGALPADGFAPYTGEEIEQARGLELTGREVRERRPGLP